MSSPSSGSLPRLGPTWHRSSGNTGGRGFQPPPPATTRSRSGSQGSAGSDSTPRGGSGSQNKFSILDDDDDGAGGPPFHTVERKSVLRSHSFGSRKGGVGRSLADLAARVPASDSGHHGMGGPGGSGRFRRESGTGGGLSLAQKMISEEGKITRFTREKLLALRPRPENTDEIPDFLKHLEGTAILSDECLDPVCWDTFDADEIWAQVKERQPRSASMMISTKSGGPSPMNDGARRSSAAPGFGKWQRGVALPPPDERRGSTHNKQHNDNAVSDNPNDLWDDPLTSTDAAADFSAFGSIPDDPKDNRNMSSSSVTTFDYDKMTEATAKFEEELRRESSIGENGDNGNDQLRATKVDRNRPLSSSGLTIKSGSGDDVNVFEDFDEPESEPEPEPAADEADSVAEKEDGSAATEEEMIDEPTPAVSSLTQSNDASSRLMDMIGVTREKPKEAEKQEEKKITPVLEKQHSQSSNPWANSDSDVGEGTPHTTKEVVTGLNLGNVTSLSSNPWGNPVLPSVPTSTTNSTGYDLQQRLQQVAEEQNRKAQEAEMQRRRQQAEEEAQRRALAQKQAEQQARAQAIQQQQQQSQSGHSQVELILMERISQILENSWGRSDLGSILSTLHNDDSRVIPLLSNTDALRALIARHPQRVAMRRDPSLGADMAILVMTNVQFQQQQRQAAEQQQAHARQEELRRLEQQRRISALAAQQKAQQEAQKAAAAANRPIDPAAPWFYSDPQGNVQGPFRGEEMRQWLEAGYFKGDLPISQEMSGPFRPLAAIFSDMANAFRFGESEDVAAMAAAKAAEEERLAREEEERAERARAAAAAEAARARAEAEAKAEAERKAREEAEAAAKARAAEAAAAAEAERLRAEAKAREQANDSSAQLKMMLGMNRSSNNGTNGPSPTTIEPELAEEPQQPPAPAPAPPKKQKKKSEKQQKVAAPAPPPIPTPSMQAPAPTPNPAATAWGGAATSQKATSRKSMSEIQQEEARAAALLAMERKATGRSNNTGWANVAAKGGGQGWQSGAIKSAAGPAVVTGPNTLTMRPSSAPRSARAVPSANVSAAAAAQRQAAVNAAAKQRVVANQQQKPANAFGAKMSPQLESWCKDQMRKLNGSDDLTLVSFCMTLDDSEEIRQYLTAYLGSTAQVNNFATEFIHRKGGGASKKEEWESTVKPKKGRKKK